MLVVYYSQPAIYRSADSKNWTLIKWATFSGTLHFPALLHSFALLCYIWCVLVNSNCNLQAMETSSSFWSLAVSALHTVSNQDEVGLGKWLPLFCTSSGCIEFSYLHFFCGARKWTQVRDQPTWVVASFVVIQGWYLPPIVRVVILSCLLLAVAIAESSVLNHSLVHCCMV